VEGVGGWAGGDVREGGGKTRRGPGGGGELEGRQGEEGRCGI